MLLPAAFSDWWTYATWEWVRNHFWPAANSPVFVSVLSLGLAWWIGHRLTRRWQRANGIFQIRLDTIRLLSTQYLRWSRTLDLPPLMRAQESADRLEDLRESLLFAKAIFRGATTVQSIEEFILIAERRTAPTEEDPIPSSSELSSRFFGMVDALLLELGLKF